MRETAGGIFVRSAGRLHDAVKRRALCEPIH
jgi:hypothetical protein